MRLRELLTNFDKEIFPFLDAKDLNKLKIASMQVFDDNLTMKLNRELKNRNSHSVLDLIMKNNSEAKDDLLKRNSIDVQSRLQKVKRKMNVEEETNKETVSTSKQDMLSQRTITERSNVSDKFGHSMRQFNESALRTPLKSPERLGTTNGQTRIPKYTLADKFISSITDKSPETHKQTHETTLPSKCIKEYSRSKSRNRKSHLFNGESRGMDFSKSKSVHKKLFESNSKSPARISSSRDKEYWAHTLNSIIKSQYESSPTLNKTSDWKYSYQAPKSISNFISSEATISKPNLEVKRDSVKAKPFRFSRPKISMPSLQDSQSGVDYLALHSCFKKMDEIENMQKEALAVCDTIKVSPDENLDFLKNLILVFNDLLSRVTGIKAYKQEKLTVQNASTLSTLDSRIEVVEKLYKETLEMLNFLDTLIDPTVFYSKVIQSSNNGLLKYLDKQLTSMFPFNVLTKFILTSLVRVHDQLKLSVNTVCRDPKTVFQLTSHVRRFIKDVKARTTQHDDHLLAIKYLDFVESVNDFYNELARTHTTNKKEWEAIQKTYYSFPIQKNFFKLENADLFAKIKHNHNVMLTKLV